MGIFMLLTFFSAVNFQEIFPPLQKSSWGSHQVLLWRLRERLQAQARGAGFESQWEWNSLRFRAEEYSEEVRRVSPSGITHKTADPGDYRGLWALRNSFDRRGRVRRQTNGSWRFLLHWSLGGSTNRGRRRRHNPRLPQRAHAWMLQTSGRGTRIPHVQRWTQEETEEMIHTLARTWIASSHFTYLKLDFKLRSRSAARILVVLLHHIRFTTSLHPALSRK